MWGRSVRRNFFRRTMFTPMGPGPPGVANGQTDQERALGAGDKRVGRATRRRCCCLFNPLGNRLSLPPRVKAGGRASKIRTNRERRRSHAASGARCTALHLPPCAVGILIITGPKFTRGIFPPADRSDLLETRKALWSICPCDERALAAELLGLQSFQASFQRATLHGRLSIAH